MASDVYPSLLYHLFKHLDYFYEIIIVKIIE